MFEFQVPTMGMPGSYYGILGLNWNSSIREIRSANRKLAIKWHPDKWCRTPSQSEEAKRRFQQIQEAYEVLSDQKRRTLNDAGLYFPDEEEDEGSSEFLQEMMSLMEDVNAEGPRLQRAGAATGVQGDGSRVPIFSVVEQ